MLGDTFADSQSPIVVSPFTSSRELAERWLRSPVGSGIDGVMAKDPTSLYTPGKRTMLKVKQERTADCVLAGLRLSGSSPDIGSMLLGLHDDAGILRHVGVVTSLSAAFRRELIDEVRGDVISLEAHPWRSGYALEGGPTGRLRGAAGRWTPAMGLDWVPLRPVRIVEVAYDQVDGIRFRHPARFRRWRPDRDPSSCTVDQLREAR
jgi:ATP-dependent DNA ligase